MLKLESTCSKVVGRKGKDRMSEMFKVCQKQMF